MSNGVFNGGGYVGARIHLMKVCVSSWQVSIASRALYLGRKRGGLKLKELGEIAGGIDYATVSNSIKRFERLMQADEKLGW